MNPTSENTVKVTADAAGNVIVPSKNNPIWGHIRVEQIRMVLNDNGFARSKAISALIPGKVDELKNFNWKANQLVEGTVVVRESTVPFNKKDPQRDYKVAGKTGIICTIAGEPVYRKTFYSKDANAQDLFITDNSGNRITHDNGEAIRAAYLEIEAVGETEYNKTKEGIQGM